MSNLNVINLCGVDYSIAGVKKFIADNKYTFHVLQDEKSPNGQQSKIYNKFGVKGMPAKFIIDKNDNIRFSFEENGSSASEIVEEVTNMKSINNIINQLI